MSHPKSVTIARYWQGVVPAKDDFNRTITDEFIDGKTVMGPWAMMHPESFKLHGLRVAPGMGQRFKKQSDGRWLKVEG